ncbi:hypothetical protein SBA2_500004 [Acidobacteriia bacterium SbA2]|nr:hypothetical protein SBA2_500004 [Acidobacteriia bacterium SbA2]
MVGIRKLVHTLADYSSLVAQRLLLDSVRAVLTAHPQIPRGRSMDEGWSASTNAVMCRHSSVGW